MAALAALLAACGGTSTADSPAAAVVDSLYRARRPFQANGAPTATDLAAMRPWLSGELATLLQQADSLRSADAAAVPEEKPAFADGDLFSSLFEGPTAYAIKAAEVSGSADSGYRVPVHFTYTDRSTEQKWTDTVLVTTEAGRPVVRDVRYGGTWDFASRGSLLVNLQSYFVPGAP